MLKTFSYNIYYTYFARPIRNLRQFKQSNQAKLEILGDLIGAVSLFAMLFVGLFFVGLFQ